MSVYALNLFDLRDEDSYRRYSRRAREAVEKHSGRVVALGRFTRGIVGEDSDPRQVMILVEWRSQSDLEAFLADPDLTDLHPLREAGTQNYLWWLFERLDDLRPLFSH